MAKMDEAITLGSKDHIDLWIAFFKYGKHIVSAHNFIGDCRGNPDFLGMKKVTIDIRTLER